MAIRSRAGWLLSAALFVLLAGACSAGQAPPEPGPTAPEPRAPRDPKELTVHGHTRQDPFYWMRDREDPRVRGHLEAENAYFEAQTAKLRPLRDELVAELRKREPVDLPLAPFEQAGSRIEGRPEPGKEYPVYVRHRRTEGGWSPEEIILDANEVAAGHAYCRVRLEGQDPSGRILAYIADTKGSGRFRLHFVDLESGEDLPETIDGVVGGAVFGTTVFPAMVFSADSRFVFYARQVPGDMRLDSIWRHRLGTDPDEDVPIYREEDPRFWSLVTRSRAGDLILLYAVSTEATEVRAIPTDQPEDAPPPVLAPGRASVLGGLARR